MRYCIYFYGYARVTVILLRFYRGGALEHKDTFVDLTFGVRTRVYTYGVP